MALVATIAAKAPFDKINIIVGVLIIYYFTSFKAVRDNLAK